MTKIFDNKTTGRDVIEALGSNAAGKTSAVSSVTTSQRIKTLTSANPSQQKLAGRNEAKAAPVIEEVRAANPEVKVTYIQCDFADKSSVREAAAQINSLVDEVHVLVNNAGIMPLRGFHKLVDGVELVFATCHLGHFLLTNLIMDKLVAGQRVVVNIGSSGYTYDAVDIQDPNFNEGKDYHPWKAYGRAKTANILLTVAIADRFGSKGVTSFAVDPGMVQGTNVMAETLSDSELMQQRIDLLAARNGGKPLPPYTKVGVQQACSGAVLVSLDDSLRGIAEELWTLSEKLVGQTFNA